jgi:hypothetical protein
VTDRYGARKFGEVETAEDVGHEAEPLVNVEVGEVVAISIYRDNARSLLSSMLLGVEAEIGQVRCLRMVPHRHETTFIMKLIVAEHTLIPQRSDQALQTTL